MYDLLKKLFENQKEMSFLFPAMSTPVLGKIEALEAEKVTVVADLAGRKVRFVTHPNSIVLTEREA